MRRTLISGGSGAESPQAELGWDTCHEREGDRAGPLQEKWLCM